MNAIVAQSKPMLPGLLSLLLIMALGVSLAKLMWLVFTPEQKINTQVQPINQAGSIAKQRVNYGKIIVNQHLFGQVKKVSTPKKPPPTAAPVKAVVRTKLNLKLHGIVAYKSKAGFALISSNNGRQKVYEKGDELEKGVKLKAIFPEKVVLDNNGEDEDLLLPVKKLKDKGKSKSVARGMSPRFNNRQPNRNPTSPPPRTRAPNMPSSAPDLAGFREKVKSNPSKLMDIATSSAAIINGDFIGLRIQPGRERKLFRQLGFRPNDIITEVNGIVLDNMSKGAAVLGALANATEVSVKVRRGNQEIFIQHSF